MATPISSAPPPFIPVQLEPSKDFGKSIEGTSANPEDTAGAEQMEKKVEEAAAKKSKARKRDDKAKGKWCPCFTTEIELRNLEAKGFIKPGSWRRVSGELNPAPEAGEWVVTKALLEDLEEKDLGTLLRVPQTGNTDPEAASEAEAPEVPGSSKRKRGSSSGPAAKRAREVLSTAATRKAEAEKKRLKLIDTSNRAQPVPVTPEVEVPPKASSTAKPDPKDVINLDDLPEDPTAKTGHGESDKGASSSVPPPEKPVVTSAEAPADEVEKKLSLSRATGTPQTHPHLFPLLQKVPLSQRHAEISAMMDQVWGPANTEEQELTNLESGLKGFFAKHKNNHDTTSPLPPLPEGDLAEANKRVDALATKLEQSEKARKKAEEDAKKAKEDAATVEELRKRLHEAEISLSENITQQSARRTSQEYELEGPEGDQLLDTLSLLQIHADEARDGLTEAKIGLSQLFPYFFEKTEVPATFVALAKCFSSQENLGLQLRQEGLKLGVEGTIALVADSQQDVDWTKVGDTEEMETKKWQALIKATKPNSKKILAYLGYSPAPAPSSSKPESRKSAEREKIALQQARDVVAAKENAVFEAAAASARENCMLELMAESSLDMAGSFLDPVTEDERVEARSAVLLRLSKEHGSSFWGTPERTRQIVRFQDRALQNTRKLHEDLRVHVLEQMTEIEGLRQNAENSRQALLLLENRLKEETAKRPAVDAMSTKIQVLEAENESLKNFLKESSEKEAKEKHTRDMAELADKLKKSQQRVASLAEKNKSQEAEAIDKMIFRKNLFLFNSGFLMNCSVRGRT
nr:uncharacterized protein LOC127329498 [Lolium perenne]